MKRFLLTLIMLFVLVLLIGVPVSAQEVGATEEAPSGEVETPPEVVTVPVDVVTNAQTANTLIVISAGVVLAIVGGGSFAVVLSRIDKRTKDETERLYLALPPQWQETVVRVLDAAEATLKLAREVTDGKPNQTPPAANSAYRDQP
ncbi:MAG: hypothetical protein IPK17_38405 [Chloroflexi bacterium]|uniref:hypothetical protein n=1 Tax=Candidatus Flexifilum breve TaxID=3140694 RepID=UPI0031364F97|nr:hypothetical protein [Chloroflexota bacterium]